jgi:hypothetical protein
MVIEESAAVETFNTKLAIVASRSGVIGDQGAPGVICSRQFRGRFPRRRPELTVSAEGLLPRCAPEKSNRLTQKAEVADIEVRQIRKYRAKRRVRETKPAGKRGRILIDRSGRH